MRNEDKSLDRSKKTLVKLADMVAGTAAAVVPGGGAAYELSKRLYEHAREYHQQRTAQRLLAFHELLIDGLSGEQRTELLGHEFSSADYTALLTLVLNDEEDEKVFHYARLLRGLIRTNWEVRTRKHLIKAFKGLSAVDFDLLLKILKATRSPTQTPDANAPEELIRGLAPRDDWFARASVENLENWGLLDQGRRSVPWPTPLADLVEDLLVHP